MAGADSGLASLYLTIGVKDKGGIATLVTYERQAWKTQEAFHALAASAFQAQKSMSLKGQGLAAMYQTTATAANKLAVAQGNLNKQMAMGQRIVNGPAGRTGGRPGRAGGRSGGPGLGTSIFVSMALAGAGAGAFRQGAGLERQSLIGSFASGRSAGSIQSDALRLSKDYNMRLLESVHLVREIQQLGIKDSSAAASLSKAGASFNVLAQDVSAEDAASSIYRLIKATSTSNEMFLQGTRNAERYAAAIFYAGNQSAAGAPAVFEMVKELQSTGQFAKFGAEGIIALSAALADMNEDSRELFRGAITRMVTTGTLDPDNPIQSLLAITGRLKQAGTFGEKVSIMESMGFDNIRDKVLLSTMISQFETFDETLKGVEDRLQGKGMDEYHSQVSTVLKSLSGSWDGFRASMDRAGATIVRTLAPALKLVLGLLGGIANVIADNPFLARMVGLGFGFLAGRFMFKQAGRLLGMGGGGGMAGNVGMAAMMTRPWRAIGGRYGGGLAAARMGSSAAASASALRMYGTTLSPLAMSIASRAAPMSGMSSFGAGTMGMLGGARGAGMAGRLGASVLGRVALGATGAGAIAAGVFLSGMLLSHFGNKLADSTGALGAFGKTLRVAGAVMTLGLLNKKSSGESKILRSDQSKPGSYGNIFNISNNGSDTGYMMAMDGLGRRSPFGMGGSTFSGVGY